MKYRIKIRQLTDKDLGGDCQFPNTATENYINHVDSILDCLKEIETVDTVNEIIGTIIIESQLSNRDDFWNSIKFLFEEEKENIKFVSAEQVT